MPNSFQRSVTIKGGQAVPAFPDRDREAERTTPLTGRPVDGLRLKSMSRPRRGANNSDRRFLFTGARGVKGRDSPACLQIAPYGIDYQFVGGAVFFVCRAVLLPVGRGAYEQRLFHCWWSSWLARLLLSLSQFRPFTIGLPLAGVNIKHGFRVRLPYRAGLRGLTATPAAALMAWSMA